jgi:hypothetical protein
MQGNQFYNQDYPLLRVFSFLYRLCLSDHSNRFVFKGADYEGIRIRFNGNLDKTISDDIGSTSDYPGKSKEVPIHSGSGIFH